MADFSKCRKDNPSASDNCYNYVEEFPQSDSLTSSRNSVTDHANGLMVIILFGGAMFLFFCRSPQIFDGWGDIISRFYLRDRKFIRDSALAMLVGFMMFLFPRDLSICKNFSAKYREDLPKGTVKNVLDWDLLNSTMPYAFSFLLGGGFTLSKAASTSGLNAKIGVVMKEALQSLHNYLILLIIIIVVVFITNFASNVAVCTVFTPIAMQLAENIYQNPLWYNLASGLAASFCFMIPVGTPGNLIVQSAAKVPTNKMMVCGFGPTVSTIIITWLAVLFWSPIIWPDIKGLPPWFWDKIGVISILKIPITMPNIPGLPMP